MMLSPEQVDDMICNIENLEDSAVLGLFRQTYEMINNYLKTTRLIGRKRFDLPDIFRACGAKTGVEVGVEEGNFSEELVRVLEGPIYLVDSWLHLPEEIYCDPSNAPQVEQDRRYKFVCERFNDRKNIKIIRKTSAEAVDDFEDESLDWVFLDANHSYRYVLGDLARWWKKLKPHGIMSGHDMCPTHVPVFWAVLTFIHEHKVKHFYLQPIGASYFFIKPDNK